ncbi:uncharacterized protein ASCRUDRAFT_8643 [Ascoidea rubescens DSM 1968]|uniref:Uncharacterized protein n=1 Tax=Ascoidea rubescens DSM 1968 TaxID=1344418 RepID=A0A1D2VFP2_9ASCO|nr:hypothetical protein ASCRUDRAFT_8643 [Ascoidea rubescens DSM 1968]ODV60419.1 hypothetical protein ASCRUDRAFT_8643 [Ascoidea rubescens DSM 1968]
MSLIVPLLSHKKFWNLVIDAENINASVFAELVYLNISLVFWPLNQVSVFNQKYVKDKKKCQKSGILRAACLQKVSLVKNGRTELRAGVFYEDGMLSEILDNIEKVGRTILNNSYHLKDIAIKIGYLILSQSLNDPNDSIGSFKYLDWNKPLDALEGFEIYINGSSWAIQYNKDISQYFNLSTIETLKLSIAESINDEPALFENLDKLTRLIYLGLSNNQNIEKIKNLDKLVNLEILKYVNNLEYLNLSYNIYLKKLESLNKLPNLKPLILLNSKISEVDVVEALLNQDN